MSHGAAIARHFRASVFWRVFAITLLLFLVVAAAGGLAALLSDHHPAWYRIPTLVSNRLSVELTPLLDDPARLREAAEQIARESRLGLTVYRADGTLLAAAGAEPLPPLSPAEAVALTAPTVRRAGFTVVVAAPLGREGGERAVLLMGTPRIEHLHRVSGFIVMLVLLVMVLSAVVAWDISRPLNRLKRQAEAFGAGDLAARTDIRRSDEIGKLAETFNEMGGRIEAMVRREKQLLADISHEIRTPLARIRVAVELCAEEEGSLEAVQRHLAGIDGDLAELETLLGDALTAFRLDVAQRAGPSTYPLASATLALTPLLDAAAERFRRADPTIKLEFRLPADLPPIRGDAILLRRLIENLLDNAVKYGDRSRPVEVEAAIEGEELAVEVADRGPGAPPEDLPHLFDPFFRSTGKGDSNIAGLGLGLTLCRRIVEAHGGTIGARQREGGGLVVRFTLAIAFPEPAG